MSIQGSVNQLFTIGGSFAGMYGLLHPEIGKRREIMKDIQASKDILSKYEVKVNDLKPNELDILEKTVERIEKNIEENPQLMKYPEIEKLYSNIKKTYPQRIELQELAQEEIRKQSDIEKSNIKYETNYDDIDWDADDVYVSPITNKAQDSLTTEGMQKVQQNADYNQRRKDKGDI